MKLFAIALNLQEDHFNPYINQACSALRVRQSVAFFHNPNWDAEITTQKSYISKKDPARYSSVLAAPYLAGKFKATTQGLNTPNPDLMS